MAERGEVTINITFKDINGEAILARLTRGLTGVQAGAASVGSKGAFSFGQLTGSIFAAYAAVQTLETGYRMLIGGPIDALNRLTAAQMGLSTVARAFNQDQAAANAAAKKLSDDGLMKVTDSARGLKNLLAAGFELPQAIKLMEAFKDSAAFNRQGMLEFGEAIARATEGIKNGNSMLVDNAGITKNLSVILKEYGFSQQDVMRVQTDVNVRTAMYNGLLKEASVFQGDAERAAKTLQGSMSRLDVAVDKAQARLGQALAPTVRTVTDELIQLLGQADKTAEGMSNLAATISKPVEWFYQISAASNQAIVQLNSFELAFAKTALSISTFLHKRGMSIFAAEEQHAAELWVKTLEGGIDKYQKKTDYWNKQIETLHKNIKDMATTFDQVEAGLGGGTGGGKAGGPPAGAGEPRDWKKYWDQHLKEWVMPEIIPQIPPQIPEAIQRRMDAMILGPSAAAMRKAREEEWGGLGIENGLPEGMGPMGPPGARNIFGAEGKLEPPAGGLDRWKGFADGMHGIMVQMSEDFNVLGGAAQSTLDVYMQWATNQDTFTGALKKAFIQQAALFGREAMMRGMAHTAQAIAALTSPWARAQYGSPASNFKSAALWFGVAGLVGAGTRAASGGGGGEGEGGVGEKGGPFNPIKVEPARYGLGGRADLYAVNAGGGADPRLIKAIDRNTQVMGRIEGQPASYVLTMGAQQLGGADRVFRQGSRRRIGEQLFDEAPA